MSPRLSVRRYPHRIVTAQVSPWMARYFCLHCGRPWPWAYFTRCEGPTNKEKRDG